KFGSLITYIPRPVTIGFTSGIAVIIFSGQLENFLGLENIEKKQYFHQNMLEIIQHLPSVNVYSILIAILGVLLVIFRSEEHTSELQSRFDLVCRLLLEKKKNIQYTADRAS